VLLLDVFAVFLNVIPRSLCTMVRRSRLAFPLSSKAILFPFCTFVCFICSWLVLACHAADIRRYVGFRGEMLL
jgi:uncharacterized membrane protein